MRSVINSINNTGKLHREKGQSCQDVVLSAENGRYSAVILADGVTSCPKAGEGAAAAAGAVCELLMKDGERLFGFTEREIAEAAAEYVLQSLYRKTAENGGDVTDYSSTLAFVLIDRELKKALYFNMGDGLIISSDGNRCRISAMPNIVPGGCYVTTTKHVERTVSCGIIDASEITSFAVMSDGAWRALYNKTKMRPDIRRALSSEDYRYVFDYLKCADIRDDHSMITICFTAAENERAAS